MRISFRFPTHAHYLVERFEQIINISIMFPTVNHQEARRQYDASVDDIVSVRMTVTQCWQ